MKLAVQMKKLFGLGLFFGLSACLPIQAQTSGTLTFTVTPASHNGSYGTEHVVAVWIENGSTAFVKTKARYANTSHTINNHLAVWKANSNLNVVDATTAATLTSYAAPIVINWNGTDVSGTVVADGTYIVNVECSWDEGTSGTATYSVPFIKSSTPVNSTPAATAAFTNMALAWVPVGVGINPVENPIEFKLFPNPSDGMVSLSVAKTTKAKLLVENLLGATVYEEAIEMNAGDNKIIDLRNLNSGNYFVKLVDEATQAIKSYKIVIKK